MKYLLLAFLLVGCAEGTKTVYTVDIGTGAMVVDHCWVNEGGIGYWIGENVHEITTCKSCTCSRKRVKKKR